MRSASRFLSIRTPARRSTIALLILLGGCITVPQLSGAADSSANSGQNPPPTVTAPSAARINTEESVRSLPNGVDLALYRRSLLPPAANARSKVVLLLHPISIPSAAAFDVKGYSLMDYLAERGFDVWAVEYRGFGHSSAAPVMLNSRGEMAPSPRVESSVADVKEAIDTVLASTGARDVALIGYGYGGLVAGMTALTYPDKVSRLVLYGAAFSFNISKEGAQIGKDTVENRVGAIDTRLPAYQEIDWDHATLKDWREMMGSRQLADSEALAAVGIAFYTTDYTVDVKGVRKVRRPTGPLLDMYRVWSNRPAFNAARIHVPTLVLRGEFDTLAEPTLAAKLTGAKIVREVVVKNATQWMLYEKARDQVLTETSRFLGGG